jgi:hypothetical protein
MVPPDQNGPAGSPGSRRKSRKILACLARDLERFDKFCDRCPCGRRGRWRSAETSRITRRSLIFLAHQRIGEVPSHACGLRESKAPLHRRERATLPRSRTQEPRFHWVRSHFAWQEGLDVTGDVYPRHLSSTSFQVVISPLALEGGAERLVGALSNPAVFAVPAV